MRMYDILHRKRQGEALREEEIRWFVQAYTAGQIPDDQAAAFCMAVCCRGMTGEETAVLTDAMMRSGECVDLGRFGDRSVDKHSTGGVGDKTTLIVSPIAASCGAYVAKMSGRGLGHTGGTVDKLESIPGYRTELTREEFFTAVERVGMAVIGQSGNLAPADKKLYALRDVTATVDSIPLIASSVMSKKLAAGARNIVLDVKIGSGAFMKTEEEGRELAERMVHVGEACGRRVCALLTDMDTPLGHAVGNALEVDEAAAVLRGGGPEDLRRLSLALATDMLALSLGLDRTEASQRAEQALQSGAACETAARWIAEQGGDPSFLTDGHALTHATVEMPVYAQHAGYLTQTDAESVGRAAAVLGAGRTRKEDRIDPDAGILLYKKPGDAVERGEMLAVLYTNRPSAAEEAQAILRHALTVSEACPAPHRLLYGRVESGTAGAVVQNP